MAIDRDAALRQAEKLLRQGKLDGAIEQYVRLTEDQPDDWNSINALGDLYLRAGRNAQAVAQFTRVADHQFGEGFFQKAAALYKKALKIDGENEGVMMQLAEIGERQGKFADAKLYLQKIASQRQTRGEERAAAECILRLGSLEGSDLESKIAAARAAQQIGDAFRAVELLKEAAAMLDKAGRRTDAFQVLSDAADIDPFDAELRNRLAREFMSTGQSTRARAYLSADTAGDDPDLLLALATIEFTDGKEEEARTAMTRVLALAPDREADVIKLAEELMDRGRVESAFACIDATTDGALLQGDLLRAAEMLQRFVERAPHVPALAKLVEVALDAKLDDLLRETQARLADAYLDASRVAEARTIAEDLLRADPSDDHHRDRLRRLLALQGHDDADEIIERIREGGSTAGDEDPFAIDEFTVEADRIGPSRGMEMSASPQSDDAHALDLPVLDMSELDASLQMSPDLGADSVPPKEDEFDSPVLIEATEVDLSAALSGLIASSQVPIADAVSPPSDGEVPAADIEDVFAQMRAKAARDQQASAALGEYEQALQYIEQGLVKEAVTALQGAARVPLLRFKAAAELGRLLVGRGDLSEGIDWLERAAEAPAPNPDDGHAVLYELASALESQGESARALAILMELDSETDGYRDVRARIAGLSRRQTGSARP